MPRVAGLAAVPVDRAVVLAGLAAGRVRVDRGRAGRVPLVHLVLRGLRVRPVRRAGARAAVAEAAAARALAGAAVAATVALRAAGNGRMTKTGQALTPATGARNPRAPYPVVQHPVVQHLDYPGLEGQILLHDAPEVLSALNALMTGWRPAVTVTQPDADDRAAIPPVSVMRRSGGPSGARFDLHSPWLDTPLCGLEVASAACGVVADLTQAFCNQQPDCLGLHCGAVQIGGQLVALTGPARAGKSTLISRLTAEPDMVVFCDDVLPVLQDGRAYAMGLAPRLRLPLPDRATDAFRAHVAEYIGPADGRYGYLCGPNIAPHGTRAEIGALIVLARDADSPARLHRMDAAEAVQHLVRQNITAPSDGAGHFDQVTRMAQDLICLKLVYSDLEAAVGLLRRSFGAGLPSEADFAAPLPAELDPVVHSPADLAQCFARSPHVALRAVGDDLFLWHAQERSYFHLNPVARAVWTLLEEPIAGQEIVALLVTAFPQTDPARIAADVAALLGAFETEFLVTQQR